MLRRTFFQSLAFAAAPRLAVSALETFRVKVNRRGNWVLVRLTTGEGVSGIGDASHGNHDEATLAWLARFFELLRGRSVHDLEAYRAAVFPLAEKEGQAAIVAASALEHCLWDIRGKVLGVPVYELFGGRVQPRIRNYANINRSADPRTPEGFARLVDAMPKNGYREYVEAVWQEAVKARRTPA